MKKLTIRAGVLILACMLSLGAMTSVFAAYEDTDTAVISGKGTVLAPADTAVIHFCIETHAKKEDAAKVKNDEIIEAVRALVGNAGNLSEESFFAFEEPNPGKYAVSRCMSLTTNNVDSVPELTQKMIEAGVTGINGTWYTVTDAAPYEEEALRLAIENAESKAAALGLTMRLSEINDYGCYRFCGNGCDIDENGRVAIECNVSVVYKRG
ncbi:MAG: SIMPL domain-containing protein [Clostridiales bacterium]|nr:SIMPL domain-containing protein [Clostridiales bacterium]